MSVGLLLLAAALLLTGYNIYDANRAKEAANDAAEVLVKEIEVKKEEKEEADTLTMDESIPEYVLYPDMEMPILLIDGERYIGYLEILDLQLVLPVMGGEWSYAKLQTAPCRYSGSIYQDNLIVAAHNYSSHFGQLKNLPMGTEIRFVDANGNVFDYTLEWVEIIKGNDRDAMVSGEDWDLTLFTCTYSGSERYTFRCVKTE